MGDGKSGGGALVPLLLLLVLLVGGGYWNYQRNVAREAEQAQDRPLLGYKTADLETLRSAYEAEAKKLAARAGATRRASARDLPGQLVGETAREFERVQRASRRVREANGDVAEVELMVARIDEELGYRQNQADEQAIFIRRLTTFDF
jgi:hypothetical protein